MYVEMRVSVCVVLFLLGSSAVSGQDLNYNLISDFSSLSGVKVTDIKQDKTGFLWVGTNEGLYRYDGYSFKLYEPDQKFIGASVVNLIYFDSQDEMWVGTRGGLLKYEKREDKLAIFRHDPNNPKSIRNNIINGIAEGADHNIWLALSQGGLDLFDRNDNTASHFLTTDRTGLLSDDLSDLHVDKKNRLWISTWDFGVNTLDLNDTKNNVPATAQFGAYEVPQHFPKGTVINFLFEDARTQDLFVATNETDLFKYNRTSDTFEPLPIFRENLSIYCITPVKRDLAWVSTSESIRLVDLKTSTLQVCPKPMNEIAGTVNVIFIDNQDNTWIGTGNGLTRYVKQKIALDQVEESEVFRPANDILALCKQGRYLWIGSFGAGLYLKDEESGKTIRVNGDNKQLKFIWDLKLVDNRLLIVATHAGLVTLAVGDISFRNHYQGHNFPSEYGFTCLTKNKTGDTWIGTWRGGLFRFDANGQSLKKYTRFSADPHYVQAISMDSKNQLWIGTRHAGLIKLTDMDGEMKSTVYSERMNSASVITSDFVSTIYEDKSGRMWIGTEGGGINVIDPEESKIEWIRKGERNLPSNTVRSFVEDDRGFLWVGFKNSISRYDSVSGFNNYTAEDGMSPKDFNFNAVVKGDSLLYFGNQSGYYFFNPLDYASELPAEVVLTDFRVNNKSVRPGVTDEYVKPFGVPLYENILFQLNHKTSTITLEFSSLNFTNPKREIYAYKLEDVNEEWTYSNAYNRTVTYSNLAPGKYIFRVKGLTHSGGESNDSAGKAIEIVIIPPFWQTLWFRISAVVAVFGIAYSSHRIRLASLRRQKNKFERLADDRIKVIEKKNIEIQEQAAKLHEADKSKLDFFTNISHEFRTPLMLIVGPLTGMLERSISQDEKEKLQMIHRNAQRLTRLMDQIMDISKIDAGNLSVKLTGGDLIKFVKETAKSFDYLAEKKKIHYECRTQENEFHCYFDHDKLEKILYNLLSNAFKVTPPYGSVGLSLGVERQDGEKRSIKIEVSNTGMGISQEELPFLFKRFYRTGSYHDGTGIGLSLTKSLVELQEGSIEVRSEEKVGTTFYLTIPIPDTLPRENEGSIQNNSLTEHVALSLSQVTDGGSGIKLSSNIHAKTILIVDDDEDMRMYISQLLECEYTVIGASNGGEGQKLAYQYQPDLIISDMMMPVMDGYQFLRALKADTHVSHIPIILLTGKPSIESRLQGLEEGADDYITKPFHEKILLARVKNLIEQRQKIKERFSTDIYLKPKEITIASLDEKFIQQLVDLVQAHIADSHFNADVICQELGIGRSYLYSKVKAITDLSVNEFIKTLKLKHAASLLLSGGQNVNEVAVAVGFNDRSHFSKSFAKQFGLSPAQYQREKLRSSP